MYNINGGRVPDRLTLNLQHGRDDYDEDNSSRTRPPPRSSSPADIDKRARCDNYDEDDSSRTRPPRPIFPAIGDKRARSPEDSDDLRAVQAQRTGIFTGRPKAKDFDDVTQEVIALAIKLYRCYVSMKYGFPDSTRELEFLRKSWAEACSRLNIGMELTPTIFKLITNRASHVRGELKTKMTDPVDLMCGFKSGQNKTVVAYNRELAESLKENLTFTFKDPKTRKGIYRAALIQKSINIMWFANSRDEGVSFPEFFNPITKPGLALVLTAAENLIDECLTGIRNNIPFTANEYRSVCDSHLKALEEFDEQTQPYKILDNILIRLHNIGRFHSGAQPLTAVKISALNKTDVAAAIREYEEDSETETDIRKT
ncbi:hypothetical protein B0H19DRAFT_941479 [Mycena capillaripes]|nr:hypothetical protein B0H19DRAFT_941479 [Mycena capillaripes]